MIDARFPLLRDRHARENRDMLADEFDRQRDAAVPRIDADLAPLPASYDADLAARIEERNRAAAIEAAERVAGFFGGDVDPDMMDAWLHDGALVTASGINDSTRQRLGGLDPDEAWMLFDGLIEVQAGLYGADMASGAVSFGGHEGATAGGATGKRWQVNSANPRSSHIMLNGEIVAMGEPFSNGMRWPRDATGASVDEVANCQCSLVYV